jgi:four helix bundle protein
MKKKVTNHRDLEVYQRAFNAAMTIFELTKTFPREERYSLVDQFRRASRSVCAQIAEGWRRRRYQAAFINKLNEAEGEAAEVQVWIEFSVHGAYIEAEQGRELYRAYNSILRTLVGMINHPETWTICANPKPG